MDLPYDPRTAGYRRPPLGDPIRLDRHCQVPHGRCNRTALEAGRGEQGQRGPHLGPEPDAEGARHDATGQGRPGMSRLWAWVLRLTTMRQENDRLIRRTERLTQRQQRLTEETGHFLA